MVQLYVGRRGSLPLAPVRELRGFTKVALEPGGSERVRFLLDERDLSRWSSAAGAWILEPGLVEVSVGASSRDLRLVAEVDLVVDPPVAPLHRNSTLAEWLAHPVGGPTLMEALRNAPGGDLTSFFENPEDIRMIGSFPLVRLQAMMGDALGGGGVDDLLAEVDSAGGAA